MAYNRWMPDKYYSGGELYHYGVKGMRWRHRKGIQIEAQEATLSGGTGVKVGGRTGFKKKVGTR